MTGDVDGAFTDAMLRAGKLPSCHRVLLVGADRFPSKKLKPLKKKLVCALTDPHAVDAFAAEGIRCVVMPPFTASRTDRLKSALVGAVAAGLIQAGETILCCITAEPGDRIDMIQHMTLAEGTAEHSSLMVGALKTPLPAALLEVLLDLALRIGREGYEGRPVGTLIVVGDSTRVMEQSHPLTLNPFQGYSETERNLFDAQVRDAVRTFAMIDGAFVVREDGVVLAAGRHIRIGPPPANLPLGFGARHMAAAAISQQTDAVAIVVSQSSGKVRIYMAGQLVLEIEPGGRRAQGESARAGNVVVTVPRRLSRISTRGLSVKAGQLPRKKPRPKGEPA